MIHCNNNEDRIGSETRMFYAAYPNLHAQLKLSNLLNTLVIRFLWVYVVSIYTCIYSAAALQHGSNDIGQEPVVVTYLKKKYLTNR